MKELGLISAGLGLIVGLWAAWLWLRASKMPLHLPGDWTYDSPGDGDSRVALLKAGEESARLESSSCPLDSGNGRLECDNNVFAGAPNSLGQPFV